MLRRACAGVVALLCACARAGGIRQPRSPSRRTDAADSGPGTLRQAIDDANANPGVDTIKFNLGFSNSTITPTASLPTITGQVTIDGTTPGQHPVIDGSGRRSAGTGLKFAIGSAAQSQIRGITITNFTTGLDLGSDADPRRRQLHRHGQRGHGRLGNNIGITVAGASQIGGTTAAERNVISDNGTGIAVTGGLGTLIEGNYIGPIPPERAPSAAAAPASPSTAART